MSLSPKLMKKLAKNGFTLEQIDFIDKEVYAQFKKENDYKIMCGRELYIITRIKDGVSKNYVLLDGKTDENGKKRYMIEIVFRNCEKPIYDKFRIVLNEFHESLSLDKYYNVHRKIVVKDYDLVVDGRIEKIEALRKYIKDLSNSKEQIDF